MLYAPPCYQMSRWRTDASARKGVRGCRETPPASSEGMIILLTVKDLSARLNIKPSTLYLWAAQGKIPCRKIHGLIRFDPDAITAWLRVFEPGPATSVPPVARHPHRDVDRLIEAAKREVYTPRHGETITPSPTGKE